MFSRTLMLRIVAIVAVVIGMSPCSTVSARQIDISGLESLLQPDFLRRDLQTLQSELQLDRDQTAIIDVLFQDYEAEFQGGTQIVREELAKIRPALSVINPEADHRQREEIRERAMALMEETRRMRESLPEGADLTEYRQKFEEQARQLQRDLQALNAPEVNDENAHQLVQEALKHIEAWQARRTQFREKFVSDLQAVLDDHQDQRWPSVERRLRREKTLAQGRLSGESIDLSMLLREAKIDNQTRESLRAIVAEYETRLDRALQLRNDFLITSQKQLLANQQADQTGNVDRLIQLRVQVRDVNEEFFAAMMQAMPEDSRGAFQDSYQQRAFSRVFRTTLTQRLLNAARELKDLSPEQTRQLEGLQQEYHAELSPALQRLATVVKQHEPVELRDRMRGSSAPDPIAAESQNPIDEAILKRDALGHRFNQRLRSILTPEQFERLPGHRAALDG